jgi:hypothetical protein
VKHISALQIIFLFYCKKMICERHLSRSSGLGTKKETDFISCLSRSAGLEGGGLFSGFSEKKTRHHELMIPPLVACLLDDLGKE